MSFWFWFWLLDYLLVAVAVASVLRQRKNPIAMLTWIFAIIVIPYLGMLLYWLMGSNRVYRSVRRRRRRIAHLIAKINDWRARQTAIATEPPGQTLPDDLDDVERLARRLTLQPATGGNEVRVYEESGATYAALEEAIRGATHHVHLEYYIWQPDATGRHFRDLLIERTRAGVECRLLLDAVGCWRLPRKFLRPLSDAGVRIAFYLPLRPFRRRFSMHMRNHRKIAVVDGRVAMTGSQNIGDEYRGYRRRMSPWIDTHMLVRGPAALFLQQTFAEDWLFATREQLVGDAYFPEPQPCGGSIVQTLPTGPDLNASPLEQILFFAVSSAKTSIRIATPYFVPDPALLGALEHACLRGVRVRIVVPTRTDSLLCLWAARSFYAELIDFGAQIFEYDGAVVHSKVVTVDDRWCLIGSANMDVRSFRLNFEITAMVYDAQVAAELSRSIERYCAGSRLITSRGAWRRRLHEELVEGAARLFAPLL
jgi:cardiolipin synthase